MFVRYTAPTGFVFPPTHPVYFRMRVAERFITFIVGFHCYFLNKLLSVPKYKSCVVCLGIGWGIMLSTRVIIHYNCYGLVALDWPLMLHGVKLANVDAEKKTSSL